MDNNYKSFLSRYTNDTEFIQTHLSLIGGKYNVPDNQYNIFYKRYYQELIKGTKMYIVEKVKDSKYAFFLDIDKNNSDDDVKNIIKTTVEILKSVVQESDDQFVSGLFDYVVSKRENKYHINFYNIIIDGKTSVAQYIILLIEKKLGIKKQESIIDASVYRTGLRMIGSLKKNEDTFYRLYDLDKGEYILSMTWEMFEKCIVRQTFKEFTKFNETITIGVKENKNTQVKGAKKIKVENIKNKELEEEIYKLMKNTRESCKIESNDNLKNILCKYTFDISRIYGSLNSLGVYCYYLNINDKYCPFKCREHKRVNSPIYIEINSKGIFIKCYDIDCIKKRYPEHGIALPLTMESEYKELYTSMTIKYWNVDLQITPDIRQVLEDSLSGTHYKIAKAMFTIYKDKYRVDEIKNSEWYYYNNVNWEKTTMLNIMLSEGLPRYYRGMKTVNNNNENNLEEHLVNEEILEANVRNQQIDSIITKLENVTFKDNLMNQLTFLYKSHDPNFYKNLDNNPYLIGFTNGVYDFNTCTFRNGVIDDYITFSTNYDYIPYDQENEYVKEIYGFISKIITNKSVREYLLKVLGKSLLGIPDEKFYFFTGLSGANGKSTLINFLEMTLGQYMVSVDTSLLTNKRGNSSNASPDVIRLKGKRIIAFQEPEHNDTLRTGILKQFSGNDSIIARELYKSPISFKLQGTMIMCCNDLPTIQSTDGGTTRRIRVIDFNSRFCDNPNPKKPNEFFIDPTIKTKLNIWKPYLMGVLLHYYSLYKSEGLTEPKEVLTATNKYMTDNDKFKEFFDTCIEESDNNIESFKNIYNHLTLWWNENNNTVKIPESKELKRALKTKFGSEKELLQNNIIKYGFNIKLKEYNGNDFGVGNMVLEDDY